MQGTFTAVISSGVVTAIITLLAVLIYLGKYREKIDRFDRELDKANGKLDKLGEKLLDEIKNIHEKILNVTIKLSNIEGGLDIAKNLHAYIQTKSPLSLTNMGKALLLDSKGKEFVDARKKKFLEEIKLKKPKTAYDVQELSKKLIEGSVELDEFNEIKEFAFRKGLNLEIIIAVLGIYLRDFLLSELDFKVEDIKD